MRPSLSRRDVLLSLATAGTLAMCFQLANSVSQLGFGALALVRDVIAGIFIQFATPPERARMFAGICRALKPGGLLLVYVPAFALLWTRMDDKVGHQRRYTRGGLEARLRERGLGGRVEVLNLGIAGSNMPTHVRMYDVARRFLDEAQAAARCARNGGLLFSEAEIHAFNELAAEARKRSWKLSDLKIAE